MNVFRLSAAVNSLRVVLRARANLRPSVDATLGTYLEFYFTDRKDG